LFNQEVVFMIITVTKNVVSFCAFVRCTGCLRYLDGTESKVSLAMVFRRCTLLVPHQEIIS
jgi:hypothetical protein